MDRYAIALGKEPPKKKIELPKKIRGKSGTRKCPRCKGKGIQAQKAKYGPYPMQCQKCGGSGWLNKLTDYTWQAKTDRNKDKADKFESLVKKLNINGHW